MKKIWLLIAFISVQISFSQEEFNKRKSNSFLKIPYTHFDDNEISGKLPDSVHAAIKPLHFFEIPSAIITQRYKQLMLHKKSWFGRKFFDENMFVLQGKDYWLTIDPVADLRLGKDNLSQKYLFQNTRAIRVEGTLGKQFSFSATIAENWARFPQFFSRYAWATHPRIVPGYALNKSETRDVIDYPLSVGYFAYKPSKFFFFEVGHGKHFIGQGYRSLFLSDNASSYPYFKVEASFWKVKYTTMWTAYQDMRDAVTVNNVFQKKFSAIHYIDWNALPKLHLGFFETVVWYNINHRGFDVNFLNPLVFFKTAELEAGSGASNAIVGLSADYRLPFDVQVYGQFVLDEMTVSKFFGDAGYWGNKFGYQVGLKYFDAFHIPNLFMRAEYNTVRPYTFSHHNIITNYAHNFQALAHPWGANFKEFLFETQYRKNRIYLHNILTIGKKGFDFAGDDHPYGGDIFRYIRPEDKRIDDVHTLQGNLGQILMNQLEAGYVLNPATNLKLFGGFLYRKTAIDQDIPLVKNETTKYFYIGFKTHLWNDHFDVF